MISYDYSATETLVDVAAVGVGCGAAACSRHSYVVPATILSTWSPARYCDQRPDNSRKK